MKLFLWLGFLVFLSVICTSCGDTFRPVIIPNPPAFPDPRASHTVMAINDNNTDASAVPPQSNPGSSMVIDVSGDSNVSVRDLGLAPVHAVQQSASQVLVVNKAVAGLPESLTKISFSGNQILNTTTVSLPTGSGPNFIATTESGFAYVSLPNVPAVGVVNTTSNVLLLPLIPVGNNPVAIVETQDGKKVYVANQGSGTVSSINPIDRSKNPDLTSDIHAPIWLVARTDSQRLYVLSTDGTLATFNTSDDSEITGQPVPNVGADASLIVYDVRLNRLYVPASDPGTGAAQLTVLDASQSQAVKLATVAIPTVPPSTRSAQDPCSTTAATSLSAVAVAPLPDASRAYVGSFYTDVAGNICPQVTVIGTSGNTVKTNIAIPGFSGLPPSSPAVCSTTRFRIAMAAAGDSSRAYLASCDGGNINFIDTATDTYIQKLPAPASSRTPIPPSNQPPPQNPVFLLAGP